MDEKKLYRMKVAANLPLIKDKLNNLLQGKNLDDVEHILNRIERTGVDPVWLTKLKDSGTLPNLDGKTVGSILEKLLVCVIEKYIFHDGFKLNVNPARGVDIPELDLGVKSPSENFCTSEPFFSAYERILGSEYDEIVLLTNYQTAKKNKASFGLQIIDIKYLVQSEIADYNLCQIAKKLRDKVSDDFALKKLIRFLAYINQSDWEACRILHIIKEVINDDKSIDKSLDSVVKLFERTNKKNMKDGKPLLDEDCLTRILKIKTCQPLIDGIVTAADNWVILSQKENSRYPTDKEWHQFLTSPLDGKIGMSFALQWRYNFKRLFSN